MKPEQLEKAFEDKKSAEVKRNQRAAVVEKGRELGESYAKMLKGYEMLLAASGVSTKPIYDPFGDFGDYRVGPFINIKRVNDEKLGSGMFCARVLRRVEGPQGGFPACVDIGVEYESDYSGRYIRASREGFGPSSWRGESGDSSRIRRMLGLNNNDTAWTKWGGDEKFVGELETTLTPLLETANDTLTVLFAAIQDPDLNPKLALAAQAYLSDKQLPVAA